MNITKVIFTIVILISTNMWGYAWGQSAGVAPVAKGVTSFASKYADDAWRYLKGASQWTDDAAKAAAKGGTDDAAKAAAKGGTDDAAKAAAKGGTDDAAKAVGKVIGGNSTILAARIGTPKGYAAHHLIPVDLKEHPILAKIGMDLDEVSNGISLPTMPGINPKLPLHRGSHPAYTAYVKKKLDEIPNDLSPSETQGRINALQNEMRKMLESGKQLHAKNGGEW